MYEIICSCGRKDCLSNYPDYEMNFENINELYSNYSCRNCMQKEFKIRYIFKKKIYPEI